MNPRILGLITARGGSKGLPRKNVLPLAGKPLVAWTIEAALASGVLDRVLMSTEDQEIASISREWGTEVPFMRPAELAQDNSDQNLTVFHALDWLAEQESYRPTHVLLLQPTSPLRTAQDICEAVHIAVDRHAPAVISVFETNHHPYLIKQITDDKLLVDFLTPPSHYIRRQDLTQAYAYNGAIFLSRTELLRCERPFEPAGSVPYIMPPERSVEVDTAWDLKLVDSIIKAQSHASPH